MPRLGHRVTVSVPVSIRQEISHDIGARTEREARKAPSDAAIPEQRPMPMALGPLRLSQALAPRECMTDRETARVMPMPQFPGPDGRRRAIPAVICRHRAGR